MLKTGILTVIILVILLVIEGTSGCRQSDTSSSNLPSESSSITPTIGSEPVTSKTILPPASPSPTSVILCQDSFTLKEYESDDSGQKIDWATAVYPLQQDYFYCSDSFLINRDETFNIIIESSCPITLSGEGPPDGTLQFATCESWEYKEEYRDTHDSTSPPPKFPEPIFNTQQLDNKWRGTLEWASPISMYLQVFFVNTSNEPQQVGFTVTAQREKNADDTVVPPPPESTSSIILFQDVISLEEYIDEDSITLPELETCDYPLELANIYLSQSFCIAENGLISVLIESDCPISDSHTRPEDDTLQFILSESFENKHHQLNERIYNLIQSNPNYHSPSFETYRLGIHWRAKYECPMHALFYSQIILKNTNNRPVKVGLTVSTQPESILNNDLSAAIPVVPSSITPQPRPPDPALISILDDDVIAFCCRIDDKEEIYLTDSAEHYPARLTYNDFTDFLPSWSPDRKKIAFISSTEGRWSLSVVNSDGTDPAILTTGRDNYDYLFPVWSPDSKKIAFFSNIDGDYEIYTISVDGTQLTDLTQNGLTHDSFPSWSPDSRKIAFTSDRNGIAQIYVMKADGTELKRLTDDANYCTAPVWSPDGNRIMYIFSEGEAAGICLMNADGTDNTRLTLEDVLTPGDMIGYLPRWSADSTKIAYLSERGNDIYLNVINVDGSNHIVLAKIDSFLDQRPFSWSPDSKQIAFSSEVENEYDIYIINVDGSNIRNLTNSTIDEFCPEWST